LNAAWDKGEGLRYVHWKILHRRWTVVLQLKWSALQYHQEKFRNTKTGQI